MKRPIHAAASRLQALQSFVEGPWGKTIVRSWQRAWEHVTPFFLFAPAIRRVVYAADAIESRNMQLRLAGPYGPDGFTQYPAPQSPA
ncbi:transposase [Paraburkholderia sp. FT54]|uniref:transposase n=1 Tax=Paraburkholderia sp. FT54 TaxID=3074437 RepID=UPI0038F6F3A6